MGFKEFLLGGMGASTNPSDYNTPLAHGQQAHGVITQGLNSAQGRPPPMANASQSNDWRSMQMAQAQQLQGIANGTQQGAGELAAQRQVQSALAGQQAMARMRGNAGGPGMVAAARNAGAIGLSGAGMAQRSALQDQQAAQGLLANALGQGRGQDQQMSLANLQAQLQQSGMNDQYQLAMLQQLTGMDATQLQAQLAAMQTATSQPGFLGGLLSAGGQVAGAYVGKPG
jgi:hypothetical protein